jgi:WD40 repeat protein
MKAAKRKKYDVFISYSQSADALLAEVVQSSLRNLGKPWNKLEALKVFRDTTNLSVSPLWPAIQQALLDSDFFLLLASPTSAQSEWVKKEVIFWLENKPAGSLMIAQSGGKILWDKAINDFDWTHTTALSSILSNQFNSEPKYASFLQIDSASLTLKNKKFALEIATISAHVKGGGVTPDDIIGEQRKQYRKLKIIQSVVLAALLVLTVYLGFFVWQSIVRNQANQEAIKGLKQEDINPTEAYEQVLRGYHQSNDSTLFELAVNIYNRNHTYRAHYRKDGIKKCSYNKNTLVCLANANHILVQIPDKPDRIIDASIHLKDEAVESIALNSSADHILIKTADSAFIFDLNGDLVQKIECPFAAFCQNSTDLLISKNQKILRLALDSTYNTNRVTQIITLQEDFNKRSAFLLSASDSVLMIGADSSYILLDPFSGVIHSRIKLPWGPTAISRSGKYLALVDGLNIRIYRKDSLIQTIDQHTDNVATVMFSPKVERVFISSAWDKFVYMHEVGTNQPIARLVAHVDDPDINIENSGLSFITFDSQNIFIWDMIGAPVKVFIENSKSEFNSVKIAPISHKVAAANMAGILYVWDSNGLLLFQDSISSTFSKNRMVFDSIGDKLFYIGQSGNQILIHNFVDNTSIINFDSVSEALQCIGILENNDVIGITENGILYKWNSSGKLILSKRILGENASALALKISGQYILTGDDNGQVHLFDWSGNEHYLIQFDNEMTNVQATDINNTNEYVGIGGNTGYLKLFQHINNSYKEKRINSSRASYVMDVAFLNRTNLLLTCGSDRSLKVWDYDGRLVSSIKTNTNYIIWDLDITDDETQVITGDDHSVKQWLIKPSINTKRNHKD